MCPGAHCDHTHLIWDLTLTILPNVMTSNDLTTQLVLYLQPAWWHAKIRLRMTRKDNLIKAEHTSESQVCKAMFDGVTVPILLFSMPFNVGFITEGVHELWPALIVVQLAHKYARSGSRWISFNVTSHIHLQLPPMCLRLAGKRRLHCLYSRALWLCVLKSSTYIITVP